MNTQLQPVQTITPQMRSLIAKTVQEILADPDFGLELTAKAKRRLEAARRMMNRGNYKITSLEEIKKNVFIKPHVLER